jgi:hypothetical protein
VPPAARRLLGLPGRGPDKAAAAVSPEALAADETGIAGPAGSSPGMVGAREEAVPPGGLHVGSSAAPAPEVAPREGPSSVVLAGRLGICVHVRAGGLMSWPRRYPGASQNITTQMGCILMPS